MEHEHLPPILQEPTEVVSFKLKQIEVKLYDSSLDKSFEKKTAIHLMITCLFCEFSSAPLRTAECVWDSCSQQKHAVTIIDQSIRHRPT